MRIIRVQQRLCIKNRRFLIVLHRQWRLGVSETTGSSRAFGEALMREA